MGIEKFKRLSLGVSKIFLLLVLMISATGCNDPVTEWKVESKYMVMTEYVQAYDEFSEFGKMLDYTKLYSLLDTRGPFTLFLPTNDAINEMYTEMGVTSFTEFEDTSYVYDFVYNHIIGTAIVTAEIGLGALRETNVLGDYIVSDFDGTKIRLNKQAIITQRDVELSNGFIDVISKTIPIIDKSVYKTLKDMPSYSIFTKGLEMAGLSDTLDMVQFDFSGMVARNRFTVFAVADTTFKRYGINTADQLRDYFTDDPSTLTSPENSFFQYMVYHCMKGTYFLSDFPLRSTTYPVISEENHMSIEVSDDYKINSNPLNPNEYTGFNVPESNFPTKNGALHTINDLLEAPPSAPVYVMWNVFDHLEITSGDWYVNHFHKWDDTKDENGQVIHFENINYSADYLQYYYKGSANPGWIKRDYSDGYGGNLGCLNMMGYWWIELTTPKIMKGAYNIYLRMGVTNNQFTVYVDGVKTQILDYNRPVDIGIHEFSATKTHKIKVVSTGFATLFWTDIQFDPVN